MYDVLLEKWRRLYQNSWYIHVFRDLSASSLSSQKHLTMKEAMLIVEKVILSIQTREALFKLKSEVLVSRKLIHDAYVYFQARKILGVEKAVYFPGPDSPDLSQALEILNNQLFLEEKMKFFICFWHFFLKKTKYLEQSEIAP